MKFVAVSVPDPPLEVLRRPSMTWCSLRSQDQLGGFAARRDGAMDRAAPSIYSRRFAREIQRAGFRLGQRFARSRRLDWYITVRAPEEGVGSPVMKVERFGYGRRPLQNSSKQPIRLWRSAAGPWS